MLFIKRLREKKLMVAVVFVVIVMLLFIIQHKVSLNRINIPSPTIVPTQEVKLNTGSLILKTQDDRKIYVSGEQINMLAFANSINSMITGFDIVVEYSPKQISYIGYESLDDRYDVVVLNIDNKILVTGSQKLSVKQAPILKDSPLIQLTFKAHAPGNVKASLNFENAKRNESNLIDVSSKDILTRIVNPELVVGEKIEINGDAPHSLDDKIKVELVSSQPDIEGCFDCITSARIAVSSDREKVSLDFKSGGIAGVVADPQEALGYSFEIGAIRKGGILLYYAKNTR